MANEIQIPAVHGLTVEVQIYDGPTPVGSPISATEVGSTGIFIASMPGGTPYGHYLLVASAVGGDDPIIGTGEIYWDGAYEMPEGLFVVQGLKPGAPATTTKTNIDAENIHAAITGDQINTTTVTRT